MNDALLKANEAYWIYDHEIALALDSDRSLLASLAKDLKMIQLKNSKRADTK